ncbi:hypothetical protein TRFO_39288 [Tritrichomonas foetus]|uniref:TRP C-terminal domain-containing protein n=1 Tax=Tritrichomonas foetus TaxID=1144522 RepID=A0A1J4JA79_9EUKA|nr:hypothetical protein TRFO_39288 [Tritrichomonas foetus]|eukprot:OHS94539.1 hypothetical protein TRFO_39288 [Tritrichomonas foetus]
MVVDISISTIINQLLKYFQYLGTSCNFPKIQIPKSLRDITIFIPQLLQSIEKLITMLPNLDIRWNFVFMSILIPYTIFKALKYENLNGMKKCWHGIMNFFCIIITYFHFMFLEMGSGVYLFISIPIVLGVINIIHQIVVMYHTMKVNREIIEGYCNHFLSGINKYKAKASLNQIQGVIKAKYPTLEFDPPKCTILAGTIVSFIFLLIILITSYVMNYLFKKYLEIQYVSKTHLIFFTVLTAIVLIVLVIKIISLTCGKNLRKKFQEMKVRRGLKYQLLILDLIFIPSLTIFSQFFICTKFTCGEGNYFYDKSLFKIRTETILPFVDEILRLRDNNDNDNSAKNAISAVVKFPALMFSVFLDNFFYRGYDCHSCTDSNVTIDGVMCPELCNGVPIYRLIEQPNIRFKEDLLISFWPGVAFGFIFLIIGIPLFRFLVTREAKKLVSLIPVYGSSLDEKWENMKRMSESNALNSVSDFTYGCAFWDLYNVFVKILIIIIQVVSSWTTPKICLLIPIIHFVIFAGVLIFRPYSMKFHNIVEMITSFTNGLFAIIPVLAAFGTNLPDSISIPFSVVLFIIPIVGSIVSYFMTRKQNKKYKHRVRIKGMPSYDKEDTFPDETIKGQLMCSIQDFIDLELEGGCEINEESDEGSSRSIYQTKEELEIEDDARFIDKPDSDNSDKGSYSDDSDKSNSNNDNSDKTSSKNSSDDSSSVKAKKQNNIIPKRSSQSIEKTVGNNIDSTNGSFSETIDVDDLNQRLEGLMKEIDLFLNGVTFTFQDLLLEITTIFTTLTVAYIFFWNFSDILGFASNNIFDISLGAKFNETCYSIEYSLNLWD